MCGRFTQERPTSELAEIFDAENLAAGDGGLYNVAPTDEATVVVRRDDRRAVATYRWGLVPHWATDAKIAARTINARLETVAHMPAFRDALVRRRCLVPVDSFYEWRREGGVRQPYRIIRADAAPLVLAGLWSGWRNPADGTVRRTFSIVTTAADDRLAGLHDRMPVMLGRAAWERWLDPAPADRGELLALLGEPDVAALDVYPVARLVNDVRNQGPALIEPLPGRAAPVRAMGSPAGS